MPTRMYRRYGELLDASHKQGVMCLPTNMQQLRYGLSTGTPVTEPGIYGQRNLLALQAPTELVPATGV